MAYSLEPREWKIRSVPSEGWEQLKAEIPLSELTLRICSSRGLTNAEAIREYLAPKLSFLTDPMKIKDMSGALERVNLARTRAEKIRVFGDYDVDGTCGTALLAWFFREVGLAYDTFQPDRFRDGYGLNVSAVENAAETGVKLLITVDCGITSFAAIERAKALGLDVIVVDHHQVDREKGLPPADFILNPQRPDCESGLKQLCGCGLAFFFAMALRRYGRDHQWFTEENEPNLKEHLDLVVIATAADQVPLTGDNRILVHHGLKVLRASKKPGVRALLEVAGLSERNLSPSHLGFVLGPRINASGRMQSASLALQMLTTRDGMEALELAHTLERLNKERADLQNTIWDSVRARVEEGLQKGRFQNAVVVADPAWHEGVIGIVAARVTEMFRKPAIVLSLKENHGKGSARSYGGKNVFEALRDCADLLVGYGGHPYAAGMSLDPDRVEEFAKKFDEAIGKQEVKKDQLYFEGFCSVADLNLRTLEELEALGPFGPGNPEPVLAIRAREMGRRVLKGRHLKLSLQEEKQVIEAMWFHGVEAAQSASSDREFEWAGVPELNRFGGRVTPTFRIRDRR